MDSDHDDLAGLIARARSGDEGAIRELQGFESEIRLMVRVRLPRQLRSQFDSMDFVQDVWQSVFRIVQEDPDRFDAVEDLRRFLAGVARNKVFEEHRRRSRTQKYDVTREEPLYVRRGAREFPRDVVAPDPSPSQDAQARDRFDRMIAGRSPQEAEIIELRSLGLTFDEIAARTGFSERTVRRLIESIRRRDESQEKS